MKEKLYIGIYNDIEIQFNDTFTLNSLIIYECYCQQKQISKNKYNLHLKVREQLNSINIVRMDTVKKTSQNFIKYILADPFNYPNLKVEKLTVDSIYFKLSFDSIEISKKRFLYFSFYEYNVEEYGKQNEHKKFEQDEMVNIIGIRRYFDDFKYKIKVIDKREDYYAIEEEDMIYKEFELSKYIRNTHNKNILFEDVIQNE